MLHTHSTVMCYLAPSLCGQFYTAYRELYPGRNKINTYKSVYQINQDLLGLSHFSAALLQ